MVIMRVQLERPNRPPLRFPRLLDGRRGGSLTTYDAQGTRILHFWVEGGVGRVYLSRAGASIEVGDVRVTEARARDFVLEAELRPGQTWRRPVRVKARGSALIEPADLSFGVAEEGL